MRESDIREMNQTITNFIFDMSKYAEILNSEAPDILEGIVLSLSTLSDISVFFDKVLEVENEEADDIYQKLKQANGIKSNTKLKNDKDINLDEYK